MTTLDPQHVKNLLDTCTPAPWVVGQDADETYTVQSIGAIRALFCHGHYAGLTAPNDLEDIHLAAAAHAEEVGTDDQ